MPASLRIACCILVLATLTSPQEGKAPASEPFVLEGRVVDLRGEGVPVAKVWLATWRAQDVRLGETVADGEGFFRMRVPWQAGLRAFAMGEGTCVGSAGVSNETRAIRIEVHDAAPAGESFALATAGADVTAPELTLYPPASVQGVVFDAQERPVPGMRVYLAYTENRMPRGTLCEVFTDRQGRYRFPAVTAREAPLFFVNGLDEAAMTEALKRGPKPFRITPGEALTFDLEVRAK
ncbi:MAG TPA: carboxypeptidase-like regulatory domain-containing protein [Planctomycetota bacterium]